MPSPPGNLLPLRPLRPRFEWPGRRPRGWRLGASHGVTRWPGAAGRAGAGPPVIRNGRPARPLASGPSPPTPDPRPVPATRIPGRADRRHWRNSPRSTPNRTVSSQNERKRGEKVYTFDTFFERFLAHECCLGDRPAFTGWNRRFGPDGAKPMAARCGRDRETRVVPAGRARRGAQSGLYSRGEMHTDRTAFRGRRRDVAGSLAKSGRAGTPTSAGTNTISFGGPRPAAPSAEPAHAKGRSARQATGIDRRLIPRE